MKPSDIIKARAEELLQESFEEYDKLPNATPNRAECLTEAIIEYLDGQRPMSEMQDKRRFEYISHCCQREPCKCGKRIYKELDNQQEKE